MAETTTPVPAREATSSTPARIAIAQGLPRSMKTSSMSPSRCGGRLRTDVYPCLCSRPSIVRRVDGATSGRPLTTLDTVGTETPAAAAISDMVALARRAMPPSWGVWISAV
jgi:hypothetical protein